MASPRHLFYPLPLNMPPHRPRHSATYRPTRARDGDEPWRTGLVRAPEYCPLEVMAGGAEEVEEQHHSEDMELLELCLMQKEIELLTIVEDTETHPDKCVRNISWCRVKDKRNRAADGRLLLE